MVLENKKLWSAAVLWLVATLLLLTSTLTAFPLRILKPGDKVPDFTLPAVRGEERSVLGSDGQITVILFWATDTESKRSRALDMLRTLETIDERYADQGVSVQSVNFDKDNHESLRQLMEEEGITVPVLLDEREEVYGAYGLFILPTVAIVNRDGILETAVGYTHNIDEKVLGQVEVMLGLKTGEELEKELHPEETIEPPENVTKAVRRLNLGRQLAEKGLLDMAGPQFVKAVELDPQNAAARAELGTFYVRQGELEKALAELTTAVELNPDSIQARFGLGMLYREKGEFDKAIAELEAVLRLAPVHAGAIRELGTVYENMGQIEKALEHYKKVLEMVFEDEPVP